MKKPRPPLAGDMDNISKTEDEVVITVMGKLETQRKQGSQNNLNPAITSDRHRAVLAEKHGGQTLAVSFPFGLIMAVNQSGRSLLAAMNTWLPGNSYP